MSRGRWGRGWEVSVRKAIWEQERAQARAAEILDRECGTVHELGARGDLCPSCQRELERRRRGNR